MPTDSAPDLLIGSPHSMLKSGVGTVLNSGVILLVYIEYSQFLVSGQCCVSHRVPITALTNSRRF